MLSSNSFITDLKDRRFMVQDGGWSELIISEGLELCHRNDDGGLLKMIAAAP